VLKLSHAPPKGDCIRNIEVPNYFAEKGKFLDVGFYQGDLKGWPRHREWNSGKPGSRANVGEPTFFHR
jgi:hypothetical protein